MALEMSVGLLMFNKTEALLPLIIFLMGFLVSRISAIRVIFVCCAIGVVLNVMQPLVSFSRDELIRRQGDYYGGSLLERFKYWHHTMIHQCFMALVVKLKAAGFASAT